MYSNNEFRGFCVRNLYMYLNTKLLENQNFTNYVLFKEKSKTNNSLQELLSLRKSMCCLFYIKGYNSYYNAVLIQVKRKRNMPCHYQICYHANRNFSLKSFIKHDNMNQNINKYLCFGNNCNLHNTCFLYTFKI